LSNTDKLVNFSTLNEMLYGEEKYIQEFANAAVSSFNEFKENYETYLTQRDEIHFRKAGHKIKPVAQMLGLDLIIEEYEYAKTLIWEEKSDDALKKSCEKMSGICNQVLSELNDITQQ